ncbi:U32 family peptidase [Clostridium thermarum]|uniref:U32 family peptidase n=1 Tax=Clostridium thermarum TaxID=1716543 RepID=UPI00111D9BD3|nr:U32 family peptidase [Clostridium thermarum]
MKDRYLELLAPAGDTESLYAAVNNGADAVYMGGSKFSARAYATNFTLDKIKEAVDYCHGYGIKIYITINTLIKQRELAEVMDYAKDLYSIGVDGIIVQDLGLAKMLINTFKGMEVHASTQMSVHNKSTSRMLKDLGFHRIVLARELYTEEIREISDIIETEVFIHGALCVCYSGQCLMSSMIGGRSGNRGRCAQPCRLPYEILDKNSGKVKQGYLLSPKDICTVSDINRIIEAGVTSFKIEGRMKKPEYVAGVVETYRKVIDEYIQGSGIKNRKDEELKLLQLFNREGFSKGYFFGNHGREMMSYNFPKNTGIVLGKAIDNKTIELYLDISIGDGIRVGEDGAEVSKILLNNKEVSMASKGQKVTIIPTIYKRGDTIYKTNDVRLNQELKKTFSDKYIKKLKVSIEVEFSPGEPLRLKAENKGREYIAVGPIVDRAVNKPLTAEFIEGKVRKTGNTPFEIEEVSFTKFQEGYISVAAINEVRRRLLAEIITGKHEDSRAIDEFKGYEVNTNRKNIKCKSSAEEVSEKLFLVSSDEQLRAIGELGLDTVAIDVYSRYIDRRKIFSYNIPNVFLKLPNIVRGEESAVVKYVEDNLKNMKGIITSNLGLLNYFKDKTLCLGDYKLNILNSEALHFINDYCDLAPLSVELNRSEIKETIKALPKNYPVQIIAYGKIELMVSEYCAVGSVLGGKSRESKCTIHCQEGTYALKDRKGMEFVIRNDMFCRSHIYNSVPLDLTPHMADLKSMGVSHFRFDFTNESYEEVLEIARSIIKGNPLSLSDFTRGHYKRGVE